MQHGIFCLRSSASVELTKVLKVKEFENLRADWVDGQIKYKVKNGIKVMIESRQLTALSNIKEPLISPL